MLSIIATVVENDKVFDFHSETGSQKNKKMLRESSISLCSRF